MRRDVVTAVVLGVVLLIVLGAGGVVFLRKERAEREARLAQMAELRGQIERFKAEHPDATKRALEFEANTGAQLLVRIFRLRGDAPFQRDGEKAPATQKLVDDLTANVSVSRASMKRIEQELAVLAELESRLDELQAIEEGR